MAPITANSFLPSGAIEHSLSPIYSNPESTVVSPLHAPRSMPASAYYNTTTTSTASIDNTLSPAGAARSYNPSPSHSPPQQPHRAPIVQRTPFTGAPNSTFKSTRAAAAAESGESAIKHWRELADLWKAQATRDSARLSEDRLRIGHLMAAEAEAFARERDEWNDERAKLLRRIESLERVVNCKRPLVSLHCLATAILSCVDVLQSA